MKDFFSGLFQYNHHMNAELIKGIVERNDLVPDKSLEWINHILNAHQIWNGRIKQQPTFGVWDLHAIEELAGINDNNFQSSISILNEFELPTIIEYKTSKGDVFKNSVRDILFHVINHSTYHRAQIALDFRNTGLQPLGTDYIFYMRDK